MKGFSCRSGVIFTTIVATMVVVTTSWALAKGPESVTLTGPGIDRPIELDTTSSGLLGRAMEQTGLWWSARSDRPLRLQEPRPGDLGPGYTLSWILYGEPGELDEERTLRQLIYPFAQGGVIVHTPIQEGGPRDASEGAGWFEAPALQETLSRLGVPVAGATSLREAGRPEVAAEPASAGHPRSLPYLAVLGLGLAAGLAIVAGSARTFRWRRVRGR